MSIENHLNQNSHRWGLLILFIAFSAFLVWAAFAPLDEGVPCNALVNLDTKRKVVQHLTGGIVKDIFVKEGQHVAEGDILITIDDAMNKARYEETRQRYLGVRAEESRLIAEQHNDQTILFHEDLLKLKEDPLVNQLIRNQQMLFFSRKSQLAADLHGFSDSIKGQEDSIRGFKGQLISQKTQLKITEQELKGIKSLVDEGYAARNQQLELETKIAQLEGDINDAESNLAKAEHAIEEIKQRAISRKEDFKKDVGTLMTSVKLEVDVNADKLKAYSDELLRNAIKSPATGQVVGLQFQTVGSIIQAGQKIMDVVPDHEDLILEAKIQPQLVDRIHEGQSADIRFFNFANSPQLVIEGKIKTLSRDLINEPGINGTQTSYYLARVAVTSEGLKKLGSRELQSGMPAQIMIKTGERSLLTYLIHPFMKRISAALKEQ
jgi:protease secretion system membrane fusion protein